MSLHAASYFAGVGTVVATMAIGFGGGVMLTDAFVGKSERTPTLMERRAASLSEATPPVVAATPTPPADQQVVEAPAPAPSQPPQQPQPQQQTVEQQAAQPQQQAVATQVATPAPPLTPQAAPQPVAAPAPQAPSAPAVEDRPRFEQSMGRTRDTDLRDRDTEARKAATAERRKQERRKWAERRKRDMEKIDELTAIGEKVRQAEREREPVFRSFAAERRPGLPVINPFGDDD